MKKPLYLMFSFSFIMHALPDDCRAQSSTIQNLAKYDLQWIHFGFTLGINNANFSVQLSPDIKKIDTVYIVESERQSGFNLGIVSNLRLGPFFDLRFIPALSFVQRRLYYTFAARKFPEVKNIESTFLEFPLELKYKSVRINNGRAYMMTGMRFNIDLASQKNINEDKNKEYIIKLKEYDYLYEVGFGIDFYLHYFKFSPELKMAFGFNNMLVKDETVYTRSLDALRSRVMLLSFTFE